MTEYIIIVAIIAIGAILIIGLFGQDIKHAFTRMGAAVSGEEGGSVSTVAEMVSETAVTDSMKDFDGDAAK